MGQKADDSLGIPLCSTHHKEQHRIGWKRFVVTYRLDVPSLLNILNAKPDFTITRPVAFVGAASVYGMNYIKQFRWLGRVDKGIGCSLAIAKDAVRAILIEEITRLHQKRNAA
jgi:hypothetical protein